MSTSAATDVVSLGTETLENVVDANGVTLVEFQTEWCGACQQLKPHLESIAADTDVTVLTVDIESHLDTAIEFGAQSTPTFVLFVDGRPVKQLRGAQTEATLRALLETYLD